MRFKIWSSTVGNATKILTAAKYGPKGKGVQVYFGTPKERGSHFNTIWEMSDKRYYHLGCEKCGKTYPFYLTEDDSWEKIWVEKFTIECPLCQHRQHKSVAIELGSGFLQDLNLMQIRWIPRKSTLYSLFFKRKYN
jgi:predicted nucleic-acid-binding Zn-ribbon protein